MRDATEELPIRARRITTGHDVPTTLRTVHCPRRGESVSLLECDACERCTSIHLDADGRPTSLDCRTGRIRQSQAAWAYLLGKVLPSLATRTPLADVIRGTVTCVTTDVRREQLAPLFLAERIDALPVVDHDGYPFGMVTKTDLLRGGGDTVADLMSPIAFTLHDTDSLADGIAMMLNEEVEQLPVVDGAGRVVGLFSATDFTRFLADRSLRHA